MILFLDTNIVIYAVENHPTFGARAVTRVTQAQSNGDTFMISDLVKMECLVGPLRICNTVLEAAFEAFFARRDVSVVPILSSVCQQATRIRATRRFKSMDSLQLAAAVEHGADIFLTNDTRLSSYIGLVVEVLP